MTDAILTAGGLCFAHGERKVIDNLSMHLTAGCLHVIVGPNGSGKSTLLDLMAGYRTPDTGAIQLDGQPISVFSPAERARHLAYMPQNEHAGFAYTVRETVMMGRHPHIPRFSPPSPEDRAKVDDALRAVDMTALADRPATDLSGGERQRTALARTLAQDAPLMLLDEPTASMDPRHALETMHLLRNLCQNGGSVLAVLHDLNLAAAFADGVTVLHRGRVATSGSVETALVPEIISEVFGVEAFVDDDPFTGRPRIALRRPQG